MECPAVAYMQEVRKAIVLSLPPSKATSTPIINCTLDVSESVRKAAYCVLASKFPLQSLRYVDVVIPQLLLTILHFLLVLHLIPCGP